MALLAPVALSLAACATPDSATNGCARNPALCVSAAGEESALCPPICLIPVGLALKDASKQPVAPPTDVAPANEAAPPKPIALPEDAECRLKTRGGKGTGESLRWCVYECVGFIGPITISLEPGMVRCPGGKEGAKVKWANIRGYRRLNP